MAEVVIPLDKGRKTGGDQLRLPPGFCYRIENAFYLPGEEDILHKILGRTSTGTLPSTTLVKGIDFLKFDTTDKLLLAANGQYYEASAESTISTWTSVDDQASTAFPRTGPWLKNLPDTHRRQIVWSGAGELPLVRDEDGNWHSLGMGVPEEGSAGVLTLLASPSEYERPNAASTPATVTVNGKVLTVDGGFTDTDKAYDDDLVTYAEAAPLSTQQVMATEWTFPSKALNNAYVLNISFGLVSTLPAPWGAIMEVQISLNGGDSVSLGTWDTLYNGTPSMAAVDNYTVVQTTLPSSQSMSLVKVRVILQYPNYTRAIWARAFEIVAQDTDYGGTVTLEAGTHYYCCTEVFTTTLASGRKIVIESRPSKIVSANTTILSTGVVYVLPTRTNTATQGFIHDPDNGLTLTRNIYRSTKTGTAPDLGLIDSVAIDMVRYVDTFATAQTTLGTPSISTVWLEEAYFYMADPPTPFLDATNHRGAVVYIPVDEPTQIKWSAPGYPEYYPLPQAFSFLFQEKSYEGKGITSLGDNLLVFLRNGVQRIRNLPFVTQPNFLIDDIEIDDLSQSEGLASTPKGYCHFHSQKGHSVIAFVSDSGIWMTDGTLVSERGLGLVKLTSHKDWRGDLDLTRLDETELNFDPEIQTIIFDYYDRSGIARCEYYHIAAEHWIQSGEDQMVPKITGPHSLTAASRVIGEGSDGWTHWSLNSGKTDLLQERSGTGDAGSNILTHIETGWIYPAGARESFQAYTGWIYHTDWGLGEACDVDVMIRRDNTGIIQHLHKNGLSLKGERTTQLGFLNGSGQAVKVVLRHNGSTVSDTTMRKAFGPIALEIEYTDERRKD